MGYDRFLARLLCTIALVLVVGCAPQAPAPSQPAASQPKPAAAPTKIKLAYPSSSAQLVDVFIAKEKGFYEKRGLDVELVFASSGTTVIQTLLAGETPIIRTAGAQVVSAKLEGADVIWIGDLIPTYAFKIFGQKGITKSEQLKGKRLGISRLGSSTDFAARAMLKKWKLEPDKDVQFVQVGTTQQIFTAMKSGAVDAGIFSDPTASQAENDGYPVIADLAAERIPYPTSGVATTRKYAKERADVVKAAMGAFAEAVAYLKANPEDSAKILMTSIRMDDAKLARQSIDNVAKIYVTDIGPRAETLEVVLAELAAENPKASQLKVAEIIDSSFAK